MRFKQLYLKETPVAYDEETEAKIGTIDPISKTKWDKAPPENMKPEQIKIWVENAIKRKVLKSEHLGSGVSKMCRYNDNLKTVFKYNYDVTTHGNQIANEIDVYKRYHSKYPDIIPKFYKWGKHWVIQEYVKVVDDNMSAFNTATGLPFIVWNDAVDILTEIQSEFTNPPKKPIKEIIKDYWSKNKTDFYDAKVINKVIENENLFKIVEFCFKTGVDIDDMHSGNLGVSTDKKVKIIDFGVRSR